MEAKYGKYRAEVVSRDDPHREGRLLVASAVLGDDQRTVVTRWATACVLPGVTSLPAVGDVVWIEFEEGDVSRPLWTGCAWSSVLASSADTAVQVDPGGLVRITAAAAVEVAAPAVRLEAALVEASGVVRCTTLVATTGVVSPSYTPGVGNVQ